MRRRRRFRSTRSSAGRKKHDWVVLFQNLAPVAIPVRTYVAGSAGTPLAVALLDDADLADKEDSLTICRMVGEISCSASCLWNAAQTTPCQVMVTLCEGIYLTADSSQTTAAFDPSLSLDVDRDNWLWLRTTRWIFDNAGTGVKEQFFTMNDYWAGMSSHMDVRVMRKLTRGCELVYAATALAPIAGQSGLIDGVLMGTVQTAIGVSLQVASSLRGFVKF